MARTPTYRQLRPESNFAYAFALTGGLMVGHASQVASLRGHQSAPGRSRAWWWQVTVLVLLVGSLYSSILIHLWKQWGADPNFSHGFFVPAFSLFVLWQDRSRL
ncbi:MAG TPA: archaeosortase/exosortase family protein, partial [Terriglobales bacterium]|nr:archaeosortase/exosortase family protein [Terriglobales bacterium]